MNIEQLAKEAGFGEVPPGSLLEKAIKHVINATLEEAALFCEGLAVHMYCFRDKDGADMAESIRNSIREMKEQP